MKRTRTATRNVGLAICPLCMLVTIIIPSNIVYVSHLPTDSRTMGPGAVPLFRCWVREKLRNSLTISSHNANVPDRELQSKRLVTVCAHVGERERERLANDGCVKEDAIVMSASTENIDVPIIRNNIGKKEWCIKGVAVDTFTAHCPELCVIVSVGILFRHIVSKKSRKRKFLPSIGMDACFADAE